MSKSENSNFYVENETKTWIIFGVAVGFGCMALAAIVIFGAWYRSRKGHALLAMESNDGTILETVTPLVNNMTGSLQGD